MGIFGAIASAANGLRILPSGVQPALDGTPRPAEAAAAAVAALPAAADPLPLPAADGAAATPRRIDGPLRTQISDIAARQGAALLRNGVLQEVGGLFAGGSDGQPDLGSAYGTFIKAWQALAGNAGDPAGQQAVINQGDVLAATVRTVAAGVEQLAARLGDDVASGLADLNQTLVAIHRENRIIFGQTALKQPADEAEARRDQLVAKVVALTGANVFARENNGVALFTATGQPLLDQGPVRFSSAASRQPAPAGAVPADGRITDGSLGALLGLAADGSRQMPPQRVDGDPGREVVRKLRSQLDLVAATVLGRSRANQPTAFADAYDGASPAVPGQLISGFFAGSNRLTLAVNPDLLSGKKTLKTAAAAPAAASLAAGGRQFTGDGVALTGSSYGTLAAAVAASWTGAAQSAGRTAQVAEAANALMAVHSRGSGSIDLQSEVGSLQVLQTAFGTTGQIGRALGDLLGAFDQIAA